MKKQFIGMLRSHLSSSPGLVLAHFSKCDLLVNNICEVFNKVILKSRAKPILSMLDDIRGYLMCRMQQRREAMRKSAEGGSLLCPRISKQLEKVKELSGTVISAWAGQKHFECTEMGGNRFVVDLNQHTCSCRKWDISGIPCEHAVSSIFYMQEDPQQYVNPCYTQQAYLKAYENLIYPVNGQEMWESAGYQTIHPPKIEEKPGRKQSKRKPSAGEEEAAATKLSKAKYQLSLKCSKCKQIGHNRRTCQQQKKVPGSPTTSASIPPQPELSSQGQQQPSPQVEQQPSPTVQQQASPQVQQQQPPPQVQLRPQQYPQVQLRPQFIQARKNKSKLVKPTFLKVQSQQGPPQEYSDSQGTCGPSTQ